jgi:phosphatidate cytidylyltransferase
MGDLPKRLLVALWGIPLLLLSLYLGGLLLGALISLLLLLSASEWRHLGECVGAKVSFSSLWLSAAAILFFQFSGGTTLAACLALAVLLALFVVQIFNIPRSPLRNLAHLTLWIVYVVIPISLWWAIWDYDNLLNPAAGRWFLLGLFVCIWITDTVAYAVGSAIGEHKLLPEASPNKSWEGAVAGFVAAPLVVLLFKTIDIFDFTVWDVIAFTIIVGIIGQVGDLLESLIKREAGIKDTSSFLPGHGGLLDRFDSLFLATPALYLYLLIR